MGSQHGLAASTNTSDRPATFPPAARRPDLLSTQWENNPTRSAFLYTPSVRWGALGPLEITGREGPVHLTASKERTVASVLALNAGKVVPDETLAEVLWGEDLPRSSIKSLHTHVFRIRKAVGADVVVRKATGYFLALGKVEVDVRLFEEAAVRARAAGREGDTRSVGYVLVQRNPIRESKNEHEPTGGHRD